MSWIIGRGDGYAFAILRDKAGPFTTRATALDHLLVHLEADRRELNAAIAEAKRMRRGAARADVPPVATAGPG